MAELSQARVETDGLLRLRGSNSAEAVDVCLL